MLLAVETTTAAMTAPLGNCIALRCGWGPTEVCRLRFSSFSFRRFPTYIHTYILLCIYRAIYVCIYLAPCLFSIVSLKLILQQTAKGVVEVGKASKQPLAVSFSICQTTKNLLNCFSACGTHLAAATIVGSAFGFAISFCLWPQLNVALTVYHTKEKQESERLKEIASE